MTIREIATLAGVSPATVSLVLNNKRGVGEDTRARVQKILQENNYSVAAVGRQGRRRFRVLFVKYRTHGMAVEENQGFIASVIDHIESECRRFSYEFLMRNCTASTMDETLQAIAQDPPDGVIWLGTELEPDTYEQLHAVQAPLVVVDNGMANQDIDSVVMDNHNIARDAVAYLHKLGHRQIGYIKANIEVSNLSERYRGYLSKMHELGLGVPEPVLVRPTLNGAYNDVKQLLQQGRFPARCAFFADNDSVAIGTSRALQEAGHKVPEDYSIMGVDDIPYSSVTMPGLTTMRVSRSALGILVLDQLRKRVK